MVAEVIQYIGVSELKPEEQQTVNSLATEYYQKLKRTIKNFTSITVHIKTHSKGGGREKFSVHLKLVAPTRIFESTKAVDWDLARTLHKAFNDLENEIKDKLHTDNQKPKSYG